jgi:hypothetical protein
MDVCIFSAKSKNSGLLFKNFFDLLTTLTLTGDNGTCRQACFKITSSGMTVFSSVPKDVCVEAHFRSKDFFNFHLEGSELCIGANLEFVKNFFRTAKKSYDVEFKIYRPSRDCLPSEMIIVIPDSNGKLQQTHRINIENIQNIELNTSLTPSISPIQINKEDFNALKSIGTMNEGNGRVRVTAGLRSVMFFSDINNIASKSICIGDQDEAKNVYDEYFHGTYIRNIHKISAFSSFVKMYAVTKQPLLFETNIGDIGSLCLWMKPIFFDQTVC